MDSAQMSLGKSAWQASPSSNKILKVGGVVCRQPKAKFVRSFTLVPSKVIQPAEAVATAIDTQAQTQSIVSKDISARDHLNLWGDVQDLKPDQSNFSTESLNLDFDSHAVSSLVMAGNDFDVSLNMFWNSDEDEAVINREDAFASEPNSEMMMVDPREVDGSLDPNVEAVHSAADELSLSDGFDLLDFVTNSSFGTDDPVFRNHIGDETLFVQDVVADPVLSTIDPGQLNFVTIAEQEIKPEVFEDQPMIECDHDELQPLAKRPRGRPRVPRTSSLKPLTKYVPLVIYPQSFPCTIQ